MEHETSRSSTSLPVEIKIAVVLGLGAALVAFIAGVVLMAESRPGTCHREAYDYPCTVHPRATDGFAISGISFGVGVVVVLLAYVALQLARSPETAPPPLRVGADPADPRR